MIDPLAEMVGLLQPRTSLAKLASAAGSWVIHRVEQGRTFYGAVLDGSCRLAVDGHKPIILNKGDFVLIPSALDFFTSSLKPPKTKRDSRHVMRPNGEVRIGNPDGPADVRMLVGYCDFGSPDAAMLVSLLPQLIVARGESRLITLAELVREEFRTRRPAREVIMARLLEVLLIEALRSDAGTAASPGLVQGLADERLAAALRRIHERPAYPWTVPQLAKAAALSRSAFFERFSHAVGVTPMEYLFAWRMALAKKLLHQGTFSITEIAERIGYGSASAFSVAFTRHTRTPPSRFAKAAS